MKNAINISFCLPVYNAQDYVDSCLKSILSVEGVEYEVILIDDCSTDSSFEIISGYALKHPNVRVLKNEENKGVSYTRNRLINEARGEFIWFVDPDDMIVPSAAEVFYKTAKKEEVNCVYANHLRVPENSEKISVYGNFKDYKVVENKNLQLKDAYTCKNATEFNEIGALVVWQGLIKKDFILKNKIYFYNELQYGEDLLFHYDILLCLDKFVKFDGVCYNYRISKNSATSKNKTETKVMKLYKNSYFMYEIFKKYLQNGKYDGNNNVTSETWLKKMMFLSAVNVIKTLAKINDKTFFNEQLKLIKKQSLFNYVNKNKNEFLRGKNKFYLAVLSNPLRLRIVRLFMKKATEEKNYGNET